MTQPRVRRARSAAAAPVGWGGCDRTVRLRGAPVGAVGIALATLADEMETTFPGTRTLPPVPRPAPEAVMTALAVPASAVVRTAALRDADDPGQAFVARLRAAAPRFAAAAGAQSAVVREAVPPARHRRSRCRVVLRYVDRGETDLTFLGAATRPGAVPESFEASIQRWFAAGQRREETWIVPDEGAPDGVAIDVTAWLSAG
jgi:hypothetical protein